MIKINNYNNPKLENLDFNKWLSKFNFLNSDSINDFINEIILKNNIEINFSNEIISNEYGFFNLEEIKEIISNQKDISEHVKLFVQKQRTLHELKRKIKYILYNRNKDKFETYNWIKDLLDMSKSNIYITSNSDYKNLSITFYKNTITSKSSLYIPQEKIFEIAFIKELYNLYYNYVSDKNKSESFCDSSKRNDYNSLVIKESLTAYFLDKYCSINNLPKNMLYPAMNLNPILYPAASFLFIENESSYNNIFNTSIESTDNALKILYKNNVDIYYKIINRELYIQEFKKSLNCIKPFDFLFQYEEYLLKTKCPSNIIDFYKTSIYLLFKKYLNLNYNILSVLDYDSRIYLTDLLLKEAEQNKVIFKEIASINKFKDFLISTDKNYVGINII